MYFFPYTKGIFFSDPLSLSILTRFFWVVFESFLQKISNDKPNRCSRKRRIEIEWASQNFRNIRQTKYFETFYRNFIGLRLRILISTPVIIMFVWFKHKRRQKRRQKKRRQKMEEVWKDKKSRRDPTSVSRCFAACFNIIVWISWIVLELNFFSFNLFTSLGKCGDCSTVQYSR